MQIPARSKAVALRICALFLLQVASSSHRTSSMVSKCPKNQNHQSPPFRTWDTSPFSYMKCITLSRLLIERKFHDSAFLRIASGLSTFDCQLLFRRARIPSLKYSLLFVRSASQKAVLRNLVVEEVNGNDNCRSPGCACAAAPDERAKPHRGRIFFSGRHL